MGKSSKKEIEINSCAFPVVGAPPIFLTVEDIRFKITFLYHHEKTLGIK